MSGAGVDLHVIYVSKIDEMFYLVRKSVTSKTLPSYISKQSSQNSGFFVTSRCSVDVLGDNGSSLPCHVR